MLKSMLAAVAVLGAAAGLTGALAASSGAALDRPAQAAPVAEAAAVPPVASCDAAVAFQAAATDNAQSLTRLSWSPFGRAERGWAIYAPVIAATIAVDCEPGTPGFADALARWQAANGINADGRLTPATFLAMKDGWQSARPFVAVRAQGICPDPPRSAQLVRLDASESYGGKAIDLRADAAAAYRAMVAAARADEPAIAADPEALQIYSGYRSPEYDAARCARDGNCGGITRASCSSHRTGYTFDLVVGHAPGHTVDSTNDANRLFMTQTPAYRWMVANAGRFGFVNYVFEPWHWEYQGASDLRLADAG